MKLKKISGQHRGIQNIYIWDAQIIYFRKSEWIECSTYNHTANEIGKKLIFKDGIKEDEHSALGK